MFILSSFLSLAPAPAALDVLLPPFSQSPLYAPLVFAVLRTRCAIQLPHHPRPATQDSQGGKHFRHIIRQGQCHGQGEIRVWQALGLPAVYGATALFNLF